MPINLKLGLGVTRGRGFSPGGGISYLLNANWSGASDAGPFADLSVHSTEALGLFAGQITNHDFSGSSDPSIVSGVYKGTTTHSADAQLYGFHGEKTGGGGFTRALGAVVKATIQGNGAAHGAGMKICTDASISDATRDIRIFQTTSSTWADFSIGAWTVDTDYQVAIVLGGFSSAGVPFKSGDTEASFLYGYAVFIKGGSEFPSWTLWFRGFATKNADPWYPGWLNVNGTPICKKFVVPDVTYPAILQPLLLDTFTDTDTTALESHNADVEPGSWVAGTAGITIVGNQLKNTSVAFPRYWQDCGESDVWLRYNVPAAMGGKASVALLRVTDENNHWFTYRYGTTFALYERVSGTPTSRASAAVSDVAGSVAVRFKGTDLKAWFQESNALSYTSSLYQTNTKHGIGADNADTVAFADNLEVFPITASQYTNNLDAF